MRGHVFSWTARGRSVWMGATSGQPMLRLPRWPWTVRPCLPCRDRVWQMAREEDHVRQGRALKSPAAMRRAAKVCCADAGLSCAIAFFLCGTRAAKAFGASVRWREGFFLAGCLSSSIRCRDHRAGWLVGQVVLGPFGRLEFRRKPHVKRQQRRAKARTAPAQEVVKLPRFHGLESGSQPKEGALRHGRPLPEVGRRGWFAAGLRPEARAGTGKQPCARRRFFYRYQIHVQ